MMYWEVHPGEATVTDVRRLVAEAMDSMPRRIRVAVTIEEKANVGRNGTGWAMMNTSTNSWRGGLDPVPVTMRMTIARRSLFLPRKVIMDLIKHEIGHGLLHDVEAIHGKEFKAFCKRHNITRGLTRRVCYLATLRWRTWQRGDYVHQVTAVFRFRVGY